MAGLNARPSITAAIENLARRRRGSALLLHLALQLERARRQLVGLGLEQEGIESTAMVHRLHRISGDAQAHPAAEDLRRQRDVAEVRQEAPLGLAVGVADFVPDLSTLPGQFASLRHG